MKSSPGHDYFAGLGQSSADAESWQLEDYEWDPKSFRAVKKQAVGNSKERHCKASSFSNIKSAAEKKVCALPNATVSCQADDCCRDMSSLTYYHVRNKICDLHIKADVFLKQGVEMRFCQRCGHPHGLSEFDHNKHSCRAQLEKHNARRRRRQAAAPSSQNRPKSKNQNSAHFQDSYLSQGDGYASANGDSLQKTDKLSGRDQIEVVSNGVIATFPGPTILDDELPNFDQFLRPSSLEGTAVKDARKGLQDSETDSLVEDLSAWLSTQFAAVDAVPVPDPTPITETIPEPSFRDTGRSPAIRTAEFLMQTSGGSLPENKPPLTPNAVLSTISVKLFGCTPSELPPDLRDHMTSWFSGRVAGMEGYLRPGCLHLLVEAIVGMTNNEGEVPDIQRDENVSKNENSAVSVRLPTTVDSIATIVSKVLARKESFWHQKRFVIQAGAEMALVDRGVLKQAWNLDAKLENVAHVVPVISRVHPPVLLASQAAPSKVVVQGYNLMQNDCEILCRLHGTYLPIVRASCLDCKCSASVSACCKPRTATKEGTPIGWESRCCGCCVSKLASLSLAENDAKPAREVERTSPMNHRVTSLGLQSVAIMLPANVRVGLLHIDAAKQLCISPSGGKVLVVHSMSIYNELASLASRAPEVADAWVRKLGIIFDWTADPEKTSFAFVEKIASRLIYEALVAGLPAIASEVLDLMHGEIAKALETVCRSSDPSNLVNQMSFLDGTNHLFFQATLHRIASLGERDDMGLLHCAVQSQNLEVLDLVLGWALRAGKPWMCDIAGPCGITPLHLAVMCKDVAMASKMILKLLVECPSTDNAWQEARDSDGSSPADYALHYARDALLEAFGSSTGPYPVPRQLKVRNVSALKLGSQAKSNEAALMDSGPQTPGRCKCQEGCPCARKRQPCASCFSSDEEEICCGTETGRCGCCANLTLPNETSKVKQVAKCCKS